MSEVKFEIMLEDSARFLGNGVEDLRIKANPEEIVALAKRLGVPVIENVIITNDQKAYDRLLIYACVRPLIQRAENVEKLKNIVTNMESWDVTYWASTFKELWWKHRQYMRLFYTIKAFKLFWGLE